MSQTKVSEVSICNQALSWLGQNPISSLDDQSKSAELCKINYPMLRDAVTEERLWTHATVRAVSEVEDMDEWGQMFRHVQPIDWLQTMRVYRHVSQRNKITAKGWVKEGKYILSYEKKVYLYGVRRVVSPDEFTQLFVQALAARIAADLAIPLTENRQLQLDMWNLYERKLSDAASRDGAQGSNELIKSDTLINDRVSSGYVLGGDHG